MGDLRAQGDGVDLAEHLRDGEGGDETDLALLAGGAQRHARQVIGILGCSEVLSHVGRRLGTGCLLEFDVGMLDRLLVHRVLEAE